MNCPKCNKQIETGALFCRYCGSSISESTNNTQASTTSANPTDNTTMVAVNQINVVEVDDQRHKPWMAIAALVMGIGSLVIWAIPFFGIIFATGALTLAILGLKTSKRSLSIAGIVLASIGLLLSISPTIKTVQNFIVQDSFKIKNINGDGIRTWALTEQGNIFNWGYKINDKPVVFSGITLTVGDDIKKWGLNYESDLANYVITKNGKMYAWKNISFGGGSDQNGKSYQSKPKLFEGLENQFISDGAVSNNYGWALTDSGDLYVWGSADSVKENGETNFKPRKINPLFGGGKVIQASISENNAFVLTKDELYTWQSLKDTPWKATEHIKGTVATVSSPGNDWYSVDNLFITTNEGSKYIVEISSFKPTEVSGMDVGNRVISINIPDKIGKVYWDNTGFRNSAFFVTDKGKLYTYDSILNSLGEPDATITNEVLDKLGLLFVLQNKAFNNDPIESVTSSGEGLMSTFCAKTSTDDAYCWGRWDGKKSTDPQRLPKKVTDGDIPGNVKSVTATTGCVFITLNNGDLYAAGLNNSGQCGIGNQKETYTFQRVTR